MSKNDSRRKGKKKMEQSIDQILGNIDFSLEPSETKNEMDLVAVSLEDVVQVERVKEEAIYTATENPIMAAEEMTPAVIENAIVAEEVNPTVIENAIVAEEVSPTMIENDIVTEEVTLAMEQIPSSTEEKNPLLTKPKKTSSTKKRSKIVDEKTVEPQYNKKEVVVSVETGELQDSKKDFMPTFLPLDFGYFMFSKCIELQVNVMKELNRCFQNSQIK